MARARTFTRFDHEHARMFLGSMDDSVQRFPWKGTPLSLEGFNEMLVYYALLGPSVCCRIGNIIYNDRMLEALMDDSKSPMMSFADTGFIQFQMLSDTINGTIGEREKIGTNSTKIFIETKDWKPGSEIYQSLDRVDKRLKNRVGKRVYKPRFAEIFRTLSQKVNLESNPNFSKIYNYWFEQFDEEERSRSNFENLCNARLQRYIDRFEAMSIINSVNHYAYGIAMLDLGEDVLIETKQISDLARFTKTQFGQEERSLAKERLIEMRRLGVFDVIDKNLELPNHLLKDPVTWKKLANLTVPNGGASSEEFLKRKGRILDCINFLSSSPNLSLAKKQLAKACRSYSSFLIGKLETSKAKMLKLSINLHTRPIRQSGLETVVTEGIKYIIGEKVEKYLTEPVDYAVNLITAFGVDKLHQNLERDIDQFRVNELPSDVGRSAKLEQPFSGLSIREIRNDALDKVAEKI